MRDELEDRAMEDNTGILNAGLDQFNAYVRRRQFNQAIALGKDMLKMKPDQFAKKHKFSTEKLQKLAKEAEELAGVIHKEQEENNGWLHPIKEYQLSRLRSSVLNNSDQWGEDFFNEVRDQLGEITGKAEHLSKDIRPDDATIEQGNKLIENIETQYNKRSWWTSPIVKWRLNSLKNEIKSGVADWDETMFEEWETKLEDIDDTYKSELLEKKRRTEAGSDDKEQKNQAKLKNQADRLIKLIDDTNSKYSWLGSPFVKQHLSALKSEVKNSYASWSPQQFTEWYQQLLTYDVDGESANLADTGDMRDKQAKEFTAIMRMKKKFTEDAQWLRDKYNYLGSPNTCWNINSARQEALANENGELNNYATAKKHFDFFYNRLKEIDDNDDSEINKAGKDWSAYSIEDLQAEEDAKKANQSHEQKVAERQKVIDLWNKYIELHNAAHYSKTITAEAKSQIYPICNWIESWIKSRVGNAYYDGNTNGGKGGVVESIGNGKTRAESSPGSLLQAWRDNPDRPPDTEIVKKQIALAIKKLTTVIKEYSNITKVNDVDISSISEDETESAEDVAEHDARWKLWNNTIIPWANNVDKSKAKAKELPDTAERLGRENDLGKLETDHSEWKILNMPGGTYEAWTNLPKEPPTAKEVKKQFQKFKARLRKIDASMYQDEADELDNLHEDEEPTDEPETVENVDGNKIRNAIKFYGPIEVQNRPWLANVTKLGDKGLEDAAAQNYAGVPSRDDIIAEYSKMQNEQAAEGDELAKKVGEDVGKDAKPTGPTIDMIGGEPVGEQLTPKQMRTIERGLDNGRKYSKEILDKYHNQRSDKEFMRLNNLKSMDEVKEAEAPPPPEPWELDVEGFHSQDDEGNPTEEFADQCSIAGEKIGTKLSAKQVAAIKQGLEKGEKYPGWLMKRYSTALSESKSAASAGEQASADLGKKSNVGTSAQADVGVPTSDPSKEIHELSTVPMNGRTIYVWKDGNGKVHRSQMRPAGSEDIEAVDYRVRMKQQKEAAAETAASAQADVGTSSVQPSQDSFTDEDVNKCIDAFIAAGHDLLSTPVGKFIKFADVYVREKLGITQVTTSVKFNARATKLIQERIKSGKLTPTTETKSVQSQAETDVGTQSNQTATPVPSSTGAPAPRKESALASIQDPTAHCAKEIVDQVKDFNKYVELCKKYGVDYVEGTGYANLDYLVDKMAAEYLNNNRGMYALSSAAFKRSVWIRVRKAMQGVKPPSSTTPTEATTPTAQTDLGSAPAKPTRVIKSDMEQGADYVMSKLSDPAGYMAEAKRFGLNPKMSGLLVRKLAREFAEDHLDMESEIDIERFVKGVQLSVKAAGGIKPPEEPQGEVIDDGTYDEVRYQKTENSGRITRSGLRIGGDPISKSGLTDKQMGLIGMGIAMSGEVRDASGKVISPGKQLYPDYVMEMYNKQLPEYQARMAEKRKNASDSEEEEFGLGGFINKTASGFDADGNPIVIGEEQVPEAIVPLANKSGNLLNRLGSKIKELISGKAPAEGEVPDQASVHATDEDAEPLISKLAKQVVDAAGLGMPDTLSNIGKKMQDFFKTETTESLTPSEAGAPSIFERIKNGVVNLTDGLLSKPSEAIRGMLSTEEERPEDLSAQTQQPPTTTPAPSTVEFKEAGELLKSQGAMTNQVKEMTEAAVKLFSLMSEAFTKSGIKVQGIDTLAQICAMGATARNDQPASSVQVVRTPPDNESGIDLRKRQS